MEPGRAQAHIRETLEHFGLSQHTLAAEMGISQSWVSRVLSGRNEVNSRFALACEETLGLSATMLLTLQAEDELAAARQKRRKRSPNKKGAIRVLGSLRPRAARP